MNGNIIYGKDVTKKILSDINMLKQQCNDHHITTAIVRVGNNGDDIAYEDSIVSNFEKLGLQTIKKTFEHAIHHDDFIKEIIKLNEDKDITGMIILCPLPQHIKMDEIAQIINPDKDLDGISYTNIARLFSNEDLGFAPCTPTAVIELLNYANVEIQGKDITIVGAGFAVGRPLSIMLQTKQATVTSTNVKTKDLLDHTRNSDIVIAAAGVKHLIKEQHIKEGTIVIDVGVNIDNDGKMYGDVDFDNVREKARFITPVPGGVGSITTSILAKRVVQAKLIQEEKAKSQD